jgi:enoyl-CoA hydratase/carnithine racemase
MLSGEQFGADEAHRIGLATHVTDDADVDGAVATMCGALAELPPKAIASTKRLLKAPFADLIDRAVSDETAAFGAALQSDEARAAFMKFLAR